MNKDIRILLYVALVLFFPAIFHPWWLFVSSLAVYLFLLWLLAPWKAK